MAGAAISKIRSTITTTTTTTSTSVWSVPPVYDAKVLSLPGSLTIATFNILAPIWKPMATDWDMESDHADHWIPRIQRVVRLIDEMDADIVCLQEYWFDSRCRDLFEGKKSSLAARYHIRALKRTGRKPDGVAILVRRAELASETRWKYNIVDEIPVPFNDVGHRVALMLRISATPPASAAISSPPATCEFIVSNTHLTFPHHVYDYEMRKRQMQATIQAQTAYRLKHKLHGMHAFLCGDFNANGVEEKDNVCLLLGSCGWNSAYSTVHNRSAGVTHLTHRNEQLPVDFICHQHPTAAASPAGEHPLTHYIHYRPSTATVLPADISSDTWPKTFTESDHRPILVSFTPLKLHDTAPSTGVVATTVTSQVSTTSSTATVAVSAVAAPKATVVSPPQPSSSSTPSISTSTKQTVPAAASTPHKATATRRSAAIVVDSDEDKA